MKTARARMLFLFERKAVADCKVNTDGLPGLLKKKNKKRKKKFDVAGNISSRWHGNARKNLKWYRPSKYKVCTFLWNLIGVYVTSTIYTRRSRIGTVQGKKEFREKNKKRRVGGSRQSANVFINAFSKNVSSHSDQLTSWPFRHSLSKKLDIDSKIAKYNWRASVLFPYLCIGREAFRQATLARKDPVDSQGASDTSQKCCKYVNWFLLRKIPFREHLFALKHELW